MSMGQCRGREMANDLFRPTQPSVFLVDWTDRPELTLVRYDHVVLLIPNVYLSLCR